MLLGNIMNHKFKTAMSNELRAVTYERLSKNLVDSYGLDLALYGLQFSSVNYQYGMDKNGEGLLPCILP